MRRGAALGREPTFDAATVAGLVVSAAESRRPARSAAKAPWPRRYTPLRVNRQNAAPVVAPNTLSNTST